MSEDFEAAKKLILKIHYCNEESLNKPGYQWAVEQAHATLQESYSRGVKHGKECVASAVEKLEQYEREFLNVYHPGENWFPMTLLPGEALAILRGNLKPAQMEPLGEGCLSYRICKAVFSANEDFDEAQELVERILTTEARLLPKDKQEK